MFVKKKLKDVELVNARVKNEEDKWVEMILVVFSSFSESLHEIYNFSIDVEK